MTFRDKKTSWYRSTSPTPFHHPHAHAPKTMFVAVVSGADPSGKIGLYPVAERREYLRNSKYHRRGDPYWKDLSCDGQFFCRLLDNEVLPACEQLGVTVLQMDNATPHRVENDISSIKEVALRHPTDKLLM